MGEGVTFLSKGKTYHLEAERMNPYVLTAGSAGRIQKLASYLDHAECSKGDRGLVVVHGTYKGTPISGVTTGMGPASCAIVLPEVIELIQGNGVLLRIGTAGSLQAAYVRVTQSLRWRASGTKTRRRRLLAQSIPRSPRSRCSRSFFRRSGDKVSCQANLFGRVLFTPRATSISKKPRNSHRKKMSFGSALRATDKWVPLPQRWSSPPISF